MKKLIFALMLVFLGCDSPNNLVTTYGPKSLGKGKPFATVQVLAPTPLSIVTAPMNDFYGQPITPFGVFAFDNSHIYFTLSVANLDSNVDWNSGSDITDTTIYGPAPFYGLKGFIHATIEDGLGNEVAVYDPIIYDAYGTVPVFDPTIYGLHTSSSFDGYWITRGWVNLTSDNNAGDGLGNPTPGFLFPTALPDGSYRLFVTVAGVITVNDPFTLSGGVVTAGSFKQNGK